MQPGSKASKCLAALAAGPRTTAEVGRAAGLTTKLASAHLVHLMRRGRVKRHPIVQVTQPRRGRPQRWLWQDPRTAVDAAACSS